MTKGICSLYRDTYIIASEAVPVLYVLAWSGTLKVETVYSYSSQVALSTYVPPLQYHRLLISWPCSQVWPAWNPETKSIHECVSCFEFLFH